MSNKLSMVIKKTALVTIVGSAFLYTSFAQAGSGYFAITFPTLTSFNSYIQQNSTSELYTGAIKAADCSSGDSIAAWKLKYMIPKGSTSSGLKTIGVTDNNNKPLHEYTFSLENTAQGNAASYTLDTQKALDYGFNADNPYAPKINYFTASPTLSGNVTIGGSTINVNGVDIYKSIQINIPNFSYPTAYPLTSSTNCSPKSDTVTYKADGLTYPINVESHNITSFSGCAPQNDSTNTYKCSFTTST